MNLVCPFCEAVYDVPMERLGGRATRCAGCGHEWRPGATEQAALPGSAPVSISLSAPMPAVKPSRPFSGAPETRSIYPVPPPFEPSPPAAPPTPLSAVLMTRGAPSPPDAAALPTGSGAVLGWLASLLAVFVLLWAAYAYREPVMTAWPPSIRVYAALGMV